MKTRVTRVAKVTFFFVTLALLPSLCWAVYYELGPSKDEWGLKYEVAVRDVEGDQVTVDFTLIDEGRLKPLVSMDVVAFSKPGSDGGRSYDAKAPIKLKLSQDGKRVGQVTLKKDIAKRAQIRILTLTINGQRQKSASYYDIPLRKYFGEQANSPAP